jgi:hypothetical protein
MLDTLLDALPDKVEDRKLRIVYCSTLITLLRLGHIGRFRVVASEKTFS